MGVGINSNYSTEKGGREEKAGRKEDGEMSERNGGDGGDGEFFPASSSSSSSFVPLACEIFVHERGQKGRGRGAGGGRTHRNICAAYISLHLCTVQYVVCVWRKGCVLAARLAGSEWERGQGECIDWNQQDAMPH